MKFWLNYEYEAMLAHSFDRLFIVTKFILPSIGDIKFSKLKLLSPRFLIFVVDVMQM